MVAKGSIQPKAVKQLVKVAKAEIIKLDAEDPLAADKLKNAAATKKLAIFDAFEILARIDEEENLLSLEANGPDKKVFKGFAEGRSK